MHMLARGGVPIHAITHYSRCALLQKLVCGDVPAGELYTANALQSPAAAR